MKRPSGNRILRLVKGFLLTVALAIALLLVFELTALHLLQGPLLDRGIDYVNKNLEGRVTVDTVEIGLSRLYISGVKIFTKEETSQPAVSIGRISVGYSILSGTLITTLSKVSLRILRGRDGKLNITKLVKKRKPTKSNINVRLNVSDGSLLFEDGFGITPKGTRPSGDFHFKKELVLDRAIISLFRNGKTNANIRAKGRNGTETGSKNKELLLLTGSFDRLTPGKNVDLSISLSNLDLSSFKPYIDELLGGDAIHSTAISGDADSRSRIRIDRDGRNRSRISGEIRDAGFIFKSVKRVQGAAPVQGDSKRTPLPIAQYIRAGKEFKITNTGFSLLIDFDRGDAELKLGSTLFAGKSRLNLSGGWDPDGGLLLRELPLNRFSGRVVLSDIHLAEIEEILRSGLLPRATKGILSADGLIVRKRSKGPLRYKTRISVRDPSAEDITFRFLEGELDGKGGNIERIYIALSQNYPSPSHIIATRKPNFTLNGSGTFMNGEADIAFTGESDNLLHLLPNKRPFAEWKGRAPLKLTGNLNLDRFGYIVKIDVGSQKGSLTSGSHQGTPRLPAPQRTVAMNPRSGRRNVGATPVNYKDLRFLIGLKGGKGSARSPVATYRITLGRIEFGPIASQNEDTLKTLPFVSVRDLKSSGTVILSAGPLVQVDLLDGTVSYSTQRSAGRDTVQPKKSVAEIYSSGSGILSPQDLRFSFTRVHGTAPYTDLNGTLVIKGKPGRLSAAFKLNSVHYPPASGGTSWAKLFETDRLHLLTQGEVIVQPAVIVLSSLSTTISEPRTFADKLFSTATGDINLKSKMFNLNAAVTLDLNGIRLRLISRDPGEPSHLYGNGRLDLHGTGTLADPKISGRISSTGVELHLPEKGVAPSPVSEVEPVIEEAPTFPDTDKSVVIVTEGHRYFLPKLSERAKSDTAVPQETAELKTPPLPEGNVVLPEEAPLTSEERTHNRSAITIERVDIPFESTDEEIVFRSGQVILFGNPLQVDGLVTHGKNDFRFKVKVLGDKMSMEKLLDTVDAPYKLSGKGKLELTGSGRFSDPALSLLYETGPGKIISPLAPVSDETGWERAGRGRAGTQTLRFNSLKLRAGYRSSKFFLDESYLTGDFGTIKGKGSYSLARTGEKRVGNSEWKLAEKEVMAILAPLYGLPSLHSPLEMLSLYPLVKDDGGLIEVNRPLSSDTRGGVSCEITTDGLEIGRIAPILPIPEQAKPNGTLKGSLGIGQDGRSLNGKGDFTFTDGSVYGVPIQSLTAKFTGGPTHIQIDQFEAYNEETYVRVSGVWDEDPTRTNLNIDIPQIDLKSLKPFIKGLPDMDGFLTLTLSSGGDGALTDSRQGEGGTEGDRTRTYMRGSIQGSDLRIGTVNVDRLSSSFELNEKDLLLKRFEVQVNRSPLVASGRLPLALFKRSSEKNESEEQTFEFNVKADSFSLGSLNYLLPPDIKIDGRINSDLSIRGDFQNPRIQGAIETDLTEYHGPNNVNIEGHIIFKTKLSGSLLDPSYPTNIDFDLTRLTFGTFNATRLIGTIIPDPSINHRFSIETMLVTLDDYGNSIILDGSGAFDPTLLLRLKQSGFGKERILREISRPSGIFSYLEFVALLIGFGATPEETREVVEITIPGIYSGPASGRFFILVGSKPKDEEAAKTEEEEPTPTLTKQGAPELRSTRSVDLLERVKFRRRNKLSFIGDMDIYGPGRVDLRPTGRGPARQLPDFDVDLAFRVNEGVKISYSPIRLEADIYGFLRVFGPINDINISGTLVSENGSMSLFRTVRITQPTTISLTAETGFYPIIDGEMAVVIPSVVIPNILDSPTDVMITITFVNKLITEKISADELLMTSDPPLPKNAIVALLQTGGAAYDPSNVTNAVLDAFVSTQLAAWAEKTLKISRFDVRVTELRAVTIDLEEDLTDELAVSYFRRFFDQFNRQERIGVKYHFIKTRYVKGSLVLTFIRESNQFSSSEFNIILNRRY